MTCSLINKKLQLEALRALQKRKPSLSHGFTLVELMIVIVIVGILSAAALPNFLSQQHKAKRACADAQVSGIAKEQQAYYAENSSFAADAATLGTTVPTACNGYGAVSVSATVVSASPTDTTNGYCVKATLASGAYTLSRTTKGAC